MLPPVVVGVDGSAESLAAAEWAAREAVRRERPLRLLHAWNPRPSRQESEIDNAARRHLATRVLREAEDRVRAAYPGLHLSDDQLEGPAIGALVKAADEADLLVVGSRGLSGFTGFLVGSVALGVVAGASRPVVLVRAGEEASDERLPADDGGASIRTGYRDVVLGIDVGEPCDEVIEFAFEAARLRHARLRAVHAWHAPGPFGPGEGDIALVDEPRRADEWLGFLQAVLRVWRDKYPGVDVKETVVQDKPANVLVRAASGASLLVVGHRLTQRPIGPRTGPVTHAAIHYVDCPVAVVPHG
ncbi:universal stress protein [Streptomyces olivochromogenes]|uniref:universal stress protein n=1 Tax=Streptomyces olivochromogenes TaxID=1963 RepID=UPI001F3BDF1B|nr:universal stress protein [Streptomyces olivochromogenes]MCF3131844.1 universal stress protein [Streptomyces olivochromogenes]